MTTPEQQTDSHTSDRAKTRSARKYVALAIAIIVAWMALSGTVSPLFGKLSSVQKNDSSGFLPSSAESTKATAIATKFTAKDSAVLPALVIFVGKADQVGMANVAAFAQSFPKVQVPGTTKTIGDYLTVGAQLGKK